MHEWKQAWVLSKIELKRQPMWFVLSALFFIFLAFFMGIGFQHYVTGDQAFQDNNPGYDLVFLFLFWAVPYWMRPKDFRYQMVASDFWVNPYFIKLQQLPIPDSVIVKSRFTTYIAQSIPIYVLFLVLMYIVSGLAGEWMPIGNFVAFSIIWLAFSVYTGHVFPASDAGDRISPFKLVLLYIVFFAIGIGIYILFRFVLPYNIVAWTVLFASEWPLLSSILSIALAFFGMRYWMYHMKKTMNRQDYLY